MSKKLNRTWGILTKERASANLQYYRKFSENVYSSDRRLDRILDILVPYAGYDDLGRGHRVDALLNVLLRSVLRDRTLAFDPLNTYEKAKLSFPEQGVLDADFGISINLGTFDPNFGFFRVWGEAVGGIVSYNPASNNGGTPDQNYVITNNLSNKILILEQEPHFNFQFTEDPNGNFGFTVVGNPTVDFSGILQAMEAIQIENDIEDKELRDIFTKEDNWVDRMAAIITYVVEGLAKPLNEEV
jgi:hypothetical protein